MNLGSGVWWAVPTLLPKLMIQITMSLILGGRRQSGVGAVLMAGRIAGLLAGEVSGLAAGGIAGAMVGKYLLKLSARWDNL